MSEYVSKKAVLEWLESEMSINKCHPDDIDIHWTLNRVSKKILSGAFDANGEVQRLRAAIKKAISMWHNTCDFADPEDVIDKMIACLNEALSGAREKEEPNHD